MTATPRATLIKKWTHTWLTNLVLLLRHWVCFYLSNYLETEYGKVRKIRNVDFKSYLVHVLQTTQNWSFQGVVLHRTVKKCTKTYNALAQPLFCSWNLLFSNVPIAVVVVVFLNSRISLIGYWWIACYWPIFKDSKKNKRWKLMKIE